MMKSTTSSSSASTPMLFTPFSMAMIGTALNKRGVYLSVYCLIIAALWNTHSVVAAPAKLDLQPPIFEASAALQAPGDSANTATTKDSYGNPIGSLQPIETPDGRKVVSAQGLQFEIPNYASGITEIKKPSDDLLPPFIGEFSNDLSVTTTARTTTTTTTKVDDKGLDSVHQQQQRQPQLQQQLHVFNAAKSGHFRNTLRFKRETTNTTTTTTTKDTNNHNNNNNNNNNSLSTTQVPNVNAIFNTNTLNLNVAANTTMTLTSDTNSSSSPTPPPPLHPHIDLTEQKYKLTTPIALPYSVTHSLGLFVNKQATTNSSNSPLPSPPLSFSSSLLSSNSPVNSKSPLSAHFNSPLSNGNFNYPNIPTDESIIERIASKYKNPLPTLDPIVVALPNETPASFTTNSGLSASVETTTVDVESVPLVKVRSANTNALPDYILELNDPDIDGPVDYMPSEDNRGLKVIAWDLLPPLESEELDKANSNKVSIATGHNFNAQVSQASSHHITAHSLETTTKANFIQNRGSVIYSSTTTTTPRTTSTRRSTTTTTTTPRPTTTPRTTTTTTTLRTTTTPRTTTTRRTTTPRTSTTTTTTTPRPDPSTFYKLENGNSYTIPTWLQDIDDPDLDVAVEFIVPEDLNQYNHTVEREILPPLEPFTDLNNLHVTPPPTTARTTTTTTTTTKRPTTVSTLPPHWVRAKPTSAKPTISSFNIQFTSLSPSISSNNFAQRTTSTTTTTTTTTVKPKTTTNYYNRPLTNNTPQTDKIGSSAESESEEVKTVQINTKNPFLQKAFDDGKYRPQNYNVRNTATTTRRPSTTTTTTTTTPSPVEKNPFEPTIPPYLLDFDYPDLGPAVPFVYDPNEDENPVDKNILPPSETSEDTNKSATPNSSNSPFSNSQTPQGFTNKFTTSAISLTSSSSIPSKITVPHPSTQLQQTNQDVLKTVTQKPPVVFVPPVPTAEGPITTIFNKNFAASFEPNASSTTSTSATTTTTNADKKVPLSADRESFPPFNNVITGSSTLPSKTTFTKSEDGKVITNNIFLSGGLGSTSVKPFGFTTSEKNTVDKSTTASSVFKQFGTTSSAASGFVTTNSDTSASFGAKYTGRFGGPPGVLAPQNNAFNTASSTTVTKTTISSHPSATTAIALTTGSNNYKFTGSFGGPPGVLKPFDNVKSG